MDSFCRCCLCFVSVHLLIHSIRSYQLLRAVMNFLSDHLWMSCTSNKHIDSSSFLMLCWSWRWKQNFAIFICSSHVNSSESIVSSFVIFNLFCLICLMFFLNHSLVMTSWTISLQSHHCNHEAFLLYVSSSLLLFRVLPCICWLWWRQGQCIL